MQKHIPINVLFGLPDGESAGIRIDGDGERPDFVPGGTANVALGTSKRLSFENRVPGPCGEVLVTLGLLNHTSKAHITGVLLRPVEQKCKSAAPCFNHSSAIAKEQHETKCRAVFFWRRETARRADDRH